MDQSARSTRFDSVLVLTPVLVVVFCWLCGVWLCSLALFVGSVLLALGAPLVLRTIQRHRAPRFPPWQSFPVRQTRGKPHHTLTTSNTTSTTPPKVNTAAVVLILAACILVLLVLGGVGYVRRPATLRNLLSLKSRSSRRSVVSWHGVPEHANLWKVASSAPHASTADYIPYRGPIAPPRLPLPAALWARMNRPLPALPGELDTRETYNALGLRFDACEKEPSSTFCVDMPAESVTTPPRRALIVDKTTMQRSASALLSKSRFLHRSQSHRLMSLPFDPETSTPPPPPLRRATTKKSKNTARKPVECAYPFVGHGNACG